MKLRFEWNWWAINRPHLVIDWCDEHEFFVSLSWGNGNSDPVWSISCEPIRCPRWIDERLARRRQSRNAQRPPT